MKTYTQFMNEVFNQSGRLKKGTEAFRQARFHRFNRAIKAQGTARGRRQVQQSGEPTVVQAKPVSDEQLQRLRDRVGEVKHARSPGVRQHMVRDASDAEILRLTGKSSNRQSTIDRKQSKPDTSQVKLDTPDSIMHNSDNQQRALAALKLSSSLKASKTLGGSVKKQKKPIERPAETGDKKKTDLD